MKYAVIRENLVSKNNKKRTYSLKELRARKNETQAEAAKAFGVSTQTYCAWEKRGIAHIKSGMAYKIAEHYGVTLDELNFDCPA